LKELKFQDDITLVLQAQKIIVHDTVRVNVSISAQVDPTQAESEFRGEIQKTLRKFIEADWKIQAIHRSKGTSKYEMVTVQATARVPERENYQLTDRANAVSRIGFELLAPTVDYSLSFDEIQKINRELRLSLINQALEECRAITDAYTKAGYKHYEYRVSSTRFDNGSTQQATPPIRAYAANITSSPLGGSVTSGTPLPVQAYNEELVADAAPEPQMDVNVSTRFSMVGYFTLRSVAF
jgi:hypothetical protein